MIGLSRGTPQCAALSRRPECAMRPITLCQISLRFGRSWIDEHALYTSDYLASSSSTQILRSSDISTPPFIWGNMPDVTTELLHSGLASAESRVAVRNLVIQDFVELSPALLKHGMLLFAQFGVFGAVFDLFKSFLSGTQRIESAFPDNRIRRFPARDRDRALSPRKQATAFQLGKLLL